MMNNLFSSFDPVSQVKLTTNWMSMLIIFFIMPFIMWKSNSRLSLMYFKFINFISVELKPMLLAKNMFVAMTFSSLFMMILVNNFTGLMPYIFTASSHLAFSLPLGLILWMSYMMFGIYTNYKHMLAHLVPNDTPIYLMSLMVLIETVSNVIRPLTLSIRLAANMVSGHLLMVLVSSMEPSLGNLECLSMVTIQTILITLEVAVSMMQAYVFTMLSVLYISENFYDKI